MNKSAKENDRALVVGASAGGIEALGVILQEFPEEFVPVVVVLHLSERSSAMGVGRCFSKNCKLIIEEAREREPLLPGHLYIAPSGYHLLIERDQRFSLSMEEKVNYSRPSIDVLFQSAADCYRDKLTAVLLSGANKDGVAGLKTVRDLGGMIVVQSPNTAGSPYMPQAAIDALQPESVWPVGEIGGRLVEVLSD